MTSDLSDTKDSFVFFRSFHEAIQEMPKKHQLAIYRAIVEYALDNREPSLSGPANALWKSFRPQIDAAAKRYASAKENGKYGKMGAEYGKMGGRPKKEKTPLRGIDKNPLNDNANVDVNENDNVDVNADVKGGSGSAGSAESEHPSFKEVCDEVHAQGYTVSAMKFFEYYEKNGWKTTEGEPIRNWKTMLKVWNIKERGETPAQVAANPPKKRSKNSFNNFEQREYTEEELEAQLLEIGGI